MTPANLYADSVALYRAYDIHLDAGQLRRLRAWCEGERVGKGRGIRATYRPRKVYGKVPKLKVTTPKKQVHRPPPYLRTGPFSVATRERMAAGQRERREREAAVINAGLRVAESATA